jgi:UDP-N-acetylglucosamine:LPS N-acetylglucosamine transferase
VSGEGGVAAGNRLSAAGGAPRAAAPALAVVLGRPGRPWHVQLVQLMEVLDPQASFHKLTGQRPEAYYNKRLATGWTIGLAQELKLLQLLIRLAHPGLVRPLQQHWLRSEPDLVVSLVPNFNRALGASLATVLPGVPFVTVMTDLADHPPHFWFEPGIGQHLICGTDHAVQQARAAGCADDRLHRVSGMVLRPDFYDHDQASHHDRAPLDRTAERAAAGLPASAPVGLVMFGGQGSKRMLDIARQLHDQPLILICGHNAALADQLRALPATAPRVVLGYTPQVRRWMQLADWFVGKPGPGSLSEAVQMGLPVVTVRNAWTMPQERWNTVWLQQQGLGTVVRSFRALRAPVLDLLARLDDFRAAVAAQRNRAVFEVPEILAGILAAAAASPVGHRPPGAADPALPSQIERWFTRCDSASALSRRSL